MAFFLTTCSPHPSHSKHPKSSLWAPEGGQVGTPQEGQEASWDGLARRVRIPCWVWEGSSEPRLFWVLRAGGQSVPPTLALGPESQREQVQVAEQAPEEGPTSSVSKLFMP